jgi:hypothetical protein
MHRPTDGERRTFARYEAQLMKQTVRSVRKGRQKTSQGVHAAEMPRALGDGSRERAFHPIRPCLFARWAKQGK